MKLSCSVFLIFWTAILYSQNNKPLYLENKTFTYDALIEAYSELAKSHKEAQLLELGNSDIGKPIHLLVIANDSEFSARKVTESKKTVLLINNGIHAGEACGIDASVELAKKILNPESDLHGTLDSVIVLIVPVYNIGGMLNRGSYSRANQNGPEEYGFRGNAKNLDLNRDFIKCASKNAKVFTRLFQEWNPDIFIDTHTTNGSDHQYTLTLINSQKDKLNPILSTYAENKMLPFFYEEMKVKNKEITPYVYSVGKSPEEKGIKAFMETPRYSSGYAALFDCFGFITEAHVYKLFTDRVEHTLSFLETVVAFSASERKDIKEKRQAAREYTMNQISFPIVWQLDTTQYKNIEFKGYKTKKSVSEITGLEMMFYDSGKPVSKKIKYYDTYAPGVVIKKPSYYIVPQAYEQVIERLKLNGVILSQVPSDTLIESTVYYVDDYNTAPRPYEGHYLHTEIKVTGKTEKNKVYQGDYLVKTDQKANRYIVEVLEPESTDGFFAWNFFDGILQQKEWFSDYAFEPKAKKLLESDEKLRQDFEEKKKSDKKFANDNQAQLYYIYKRSPYFEKTVNRYPIFRIE